MTGYLCCGLQHSPSSLRCLYQQSYGTRDKPLESTFTFKTNQELIVDRLVKLRVYSPDSRCASAQLQGRHDVETIETSPSFVFVDRVKRRSVASGFLERLVVFGGGSGMNNVHEQMSRLHKLQDQTTVSCPPHHCHGRVQCRRGPRNWSHASVDHTIARLGQCYVWSAR